MHLIRRELPKEIGAGYRWSLVAMKVVDGDGSPYVAFESASAASEFIATLPPTSVYSCVEHWCIGLDTYLNPNPSALVFSSLEQMIAYRGGAVQHVPHVQIGTTGVFQRIVRKGKNWYASYHNRKLAHEG